MSSRPKLLFLCHVLPYPADSGVAIRTCNVIRQLSSTFEVTALCFYRRKARASGEQVIASVAALGEWAHVEAFPIPQEASRIRYLWDHLRSLASGRAYTRFVYESERFRSRVRDLVRRGGFDLAHVDSLDLCAYLPELEKLQVVCTHHNVESVLLRRRAEGETGLRRAYVRLQAWLTRREEAKWCDRVTVNVAVSTADAEILRSIAPEARYFVVPNGVDVEEFQPEPRTGNAVVFLGGTEWFPNVDALDYFCRDVLPHLRAAGVHVPVRWVGRATRDEIESYRVRYGVELTGYVEDIRPYVQDALCTIVPLRIGGGTRLKITTAWSMGKPVVSTSIGCEGLATRNGENILVRDTPIAFAEAIRQLLRDERLERELSAAGRATAQCVYSWNVVGARMVDRYLRLIDWPGGERRLVERGAISDPELARAFPALTSVEH